ncbi:MAG: HD domain-containing protein [Clostridia bacterium]|nr:HD domain-containing protein [Clostridia bacterium]
MKIELSVKNARIVLYKYLGSNQKRLLHSERVAKISVELAKKYHVSQIEAAIAGLLHDIGKALQDTNLNYGKSYNVAMLEYCLRNNITMYDFELFDNISALHGRISGSFFEKEFGEEEDKDAFNRIKMAIERHVAGSEEMCLLDKIIFIADNVEPDKKDHYLLSSLTNGEKDIDGVIKEIITNKKNRAMRKKLPYNPLLDSNNEYLER